MRPLLYTDSIPAAHPFVQVRCVEEDAPYMVTAHGEVTGQRHGFVDGMRPIPRELLPGYDSGVAALLIVALLIPALSLRHHTGFFKSLWSGLIEVRKHRPNVFDASEASLDETRITLSLLLVTCLCEGILLYFASGTGLLTAMGSIFAAISVGTVGAICLMVAQGLSYRACGYMFADGDMTLSWLKGFRASQVLLGFCLLAPALWSLFNPADAMIMVQVGAALYLLCRIIFVYKGFRIFYSNIFSLVYFIVYLCTLEIAPILMLYRTLAQFGL